MANLQSHLNGTDEASLWRLFFAVPLPPATADAVHPRARRISADIPGARPIPVSNLHITLRFLGDTPRSEVARLCELARSIADASEAFSVALAGIGAFPSARRARVVWLGCSAGTPELRRLAAALADIGLASGAAEKRFHPHVTLARLHSPAAVPPRWLDGCGQRARRLGPPAAGTEHKFDEAGRHEDAQTSSHDLAFRVDAFTLMQSHLGPQGARYATLARFKLGC